MKNTAKLNLSLTAVATALAVGCAGTAVSEKPREIQSSSTLSVQTTQAVPESNKSTEPVIIKSEDTKAEAKATAVTPVAANEQPGKYPHIPLAGGKKPQQRVFHFGFDKTELEESDHAILKQHARYLQNHPETILQIQGHTDHHGPKAYNEYLSKQRAETVAKALIEYGAPESQLVIDAMGDSQPLQDNQNTAQNRRVELNYQVIEMVHSD